MEITTNTPAREWYTDGPHNNPSYWPLDYPPGSAYQSWVHGKMVAAVEPAAVALGTSRGYETPTSKQLLRWTVVLSDAATFFPAALAAARLLRPPPGAGSAPASEAFVLAALLLNPAHVLIDHGHFQYNCISLGLALGAAVAIAARGRHLLGSVLFCAALSHKQMSLFYAPAFFAHLLGRCLERPGAARKVRRAPAGLVGGGSRGLVRGATHSRDLRRLHSHSSRPPLPWPRRSAAWLCWASPWSPPLRCCGRPTSGRSTRSSRWAQRLGARGARCRLARLHARVQPRTAPRGPAAAPPRPPPHRPPACGAPRRSWPASSRCAAGCTRTTSPTGGVPRRWRSSGSPCWRRRCWCACARA
jgi:hypothetical protein